MTAATSYNMNVDEFIRDLRGGLNQPDLADAVVKSLDGKEPADVSMDDFMAHGSEFLHGLSEADRGKVLYYVDVCY
jgi:hypothetical protein